MTPDTAALRAQIRANEDAAAFYGGTPNRIILDPATVRALCDAADEVERLRADRDALREQVQRLRASRESNRGGWARTLVERDALRAAVDRVRALGERDGRDRLAAWLASNGVEQADTVAVEAAAFVLTALESGNYGTPEWFSSIDKPLFPLEAESSCPACERDDAADEVERLREDVEALHGLLSAGAIGTAPGSDSHRMVLAMRDHYKRQRDASRTAHAALDAELRAKVAEARTWRGYKTRDIGDAFDATTVTDLLDDLTALLDRHAPTLTTTED